MFVYGITFFNVFTVDQSPYVNWDLCSRHVRKYASSVCHQFIDKSQDKRLLPDEDPLLLEYDELTSMLPVSLLARAVNTIIVSTLRFYGMRCIGLQMSDIAGCLILSPEHFLLLA